MAGRGGVLSLIIALAMTATGCKTVDVEKLAVALPEAPKEWSAETSWQTPPVGDWLATFEDETLEALVAEAMLANNDLLAAASNLRAAREAAKVTRANQLPTLDANPSASRNAFVTDPSFAAQSGGGDASLAGTRANDLEDQFGVDIDNDGELDGLDLLAPDPNTGELVSGQDGIPDSPLPNRRAWINNYALGAQVQWEVDLWGRLLDETKAANRDASASLADYAAARQSIASSVAQAWFALIEARQQRELADRDVAARERNLRVTERRYNRGVATSLDVRLSRSALGSSQATQALQSRLEKEAGRRLEVLLGRYPSAELSAAPSLPSLPRLKGVGAPGDILARRPDLAAAELRMEAAGLRARAARKLMLPRLTLSSQISTSGPQLDNVIDPERLAGNAAAGLVMPLFRGGRLKASARQARAQAEASLLSYAQTALQAYEEAENAIAAETYLAAREGALRLAYEEAAEAEKITERRYAEGASSIFNLLDAQTRRISSESAYILAQRERVANRVVLYLAIGGDFIAPDALEIDPFGQIDEPAIENAGDGKAITTALNENALVKTAIVDTDAGRSEIRRTSGNGSKD
ncbi:MAG: TolC family protein [Pseudomonadota bacterium]